MDVAVDPADEIAELVALAEAQLAEMRQSGAMRSDAYRTALGVLASVTKLQAAVAKKLRPAGLTPAEREAFKVELIRAAGRDGRLLGQQLQRRNIVGMSCAIGGAFVLGSVGTLGVLAATAIGPFSRDAQAGASWREVEAQNPDPRQSLSAAQILTDRATGRRYYAGVSLWLDPPQAAPAGVKAR